MGSITAGVSCTALKSPTGFLMIPGGEGSIGEIHVMACDHRMAFHHVMTGHHVMTWDHIMPFHHVMTGQHVMTCDHLMALHHR